jgi:hypothetical protein
MRIAKALLLLALLALLIYSADAKFKLGGLIKKTAKVVSKAVKQTPFGQKVTSVIGKYKKFTGFAKNPKGAISALLKRGIKYGKKQLRKQAGNLRSSINMSAQQLVGQALQAGNQRLSQFGVPMQQPQQPPQEFAPEGPQNPEGQYPSGPGDFGGFDPNQGNPASPDQGFDPNQQGPDQFGPQEDYYEDYDEDYSEY